VFRSVFWPYLARQSNYFALVGLLTNVVQALIFLVCVSGDVLDGSFSAC
jgi:hypothetical protein